MSSGLLAVTFDVHHDPAPVAQFWAGMLRRDVATTSGSALVPSEGNQIGLRFVGSPVPKAGPNRMHLHLTSSSSGGQEQTVARALGLGAQHLDVGQRPEEGHVVLADPGGNEFCVIEPGNSFLAGCGFLGELACDGTREVGLFWSEALGWPLVWDQDQETAVQSPAGGTKIAWGGPPVAPHGTTTRQRFDLITTEDDLGHEVDRLLDLGAARLEDGEDDDVRMVDPDGNEFRLLTVGT